MDERQHCAVVYLADVAPSYWPAAKAIEAARAEQDQAQALNLPSRSRILALLYGLGPFLDENPGSVVVEVLESEARLDAERAAIASSVLQPVFYGGEGSRPPPGFGKRVAPRDHQARRKAKAA